MVMMFTLAKEKIEPPCARR